MNRDDDKNFYDKFYDIVSQIVDDQSLFESSPPENCHDLIVDGKIMCDALADFKLLGLSFWKTFREIDLVEIETAITEYKTILLPPKIPFGLGSCCPCLIKLKRSGVSFETKLLKTHAVIIHTGYNVGMIVVERAVNVMVFESLRFMQYVEVMNTISDKLANVSTKGSEQARDNAREELLGLIDEVRRFVKLNFEEDGPHNEFRMEALRRLSQADELLSTQSTANRNRLATPEQTPQQRGVHRRILIKAQSSMQEIMNSVAGIAQQKAKDYSSDAYDENKTEASMMHAKFMNVKEKRRLGIDKIEGRMLELQLNDTLDRINYISENKNQEIENKMKEAMKRWIMVKSRSNFRNVAVYEEEEEIKTGLDQLKDPMRAINKTGNDVKKGLNDIGKNVKNLPGNAASAMMGGISGAVGAVTGGVKNAATGLANGVKDLSSGIAEGVGLKQSSPQPTGGGRQYTVVCTAKVNHAFAGTGPNQMALKKGETIDVLRRGKPGEWSLGRLGSFPTDYVQFNAPAAPQQRAQPSQQNGISPARGGYTAVSSGGFFG